MYCVLYPAEQNCKTSPGGLLVFLARVVDLGHDLSALARGLAGVLDVVHVAVVHPRDAERLGVRRQRLQFHDRGDIALGALYAGLIAAAQLPGVDAPEGMFT